MADKKVQMNVTLTDGTVINAGQFTVPEGPAGPEGPGINWKGKWVAGNEVFKDDAYSYQGSSYVANKDNAAGPPTPVNPDWSMLAARGNDGANGTDGAPGTPGTPGVDGVTPLQAVNIVNASSLPATGGTFYVSVDNLNRMPVVGDRCMLFVNYIGRHFICSIEITATTVTVANYKYNSVTEFGQSINSISVVEVA